MEFYIGQTFTPPYPPEVATWCYRNNAQIKVREDGLREIIAMPEPPAPTHEEIERARIAYRREHIDDETLCRLRKQANGTWTQEMEDAYLALDAEVTAYIEENFPYPEE